MTQPITPTMRTTPQMVIKILGAHNARKIKSLNLEPFIAAANQLTTFCANQPISPTAPQQTAYSDYQLQMLETWLAAHFTAMMEPSFRKTSENMGGASQSLMAAPGMNLSMTPFGQQALLIDLNGNLAYLDKHISQGHRSVPTIYYLGTNHNNLYGYGGQPWRFMSLC